MSHLASDPYRTNECFDAIVFYLISFRFFVMDQVDSTHKANKIEIRKNRYNFVVGNFGFRELEKLLNQWVWNDQAICVGRLLFYCCSFTLYIFMSDSPLLVPFCDSLSLSLSVSLCAFLFSLLLYLVFFSVSILVHLCFTIFAEHFFYRTTKSASVCFKECACMKENRI